MKEDMRSSQLQLDRYDSDKISNRYLERYDPILKPWLNKKISLLELGVHTGGSLLLWRDYFPSGTIIGIDIRLPTELKTTDRIHVYEGNQADVEFLSRVANEVAPEGFDIIIDDASHIGELTKVTFWHLFKNHLRLGGLYVIEDWGTGYWDDWPDGRSLDLDSYSRTSLRHRPSPFWQKVARGLHLPPFKRPMRCHSYGMVGFIKQLVDEQGAHDVTRRGLGGRPKRGSMFESMTITPSIAFIKKASGLPESQ